MDVIGSDSARLRDSLGWKLVVIGVLILLLLIPLMMVGMLVVERSGRRQQAVNELSATWGGEQTLGGPLLSVPFRVRGEDKEGKPTVWREKAHFLPEALRIEGRVSPELRRRGIFEAVLYRADLKVAGTFAPPDPQVFAGWGVAADDILWDEATITIGLADLRGVRREVRLAWDGRPLPMAPAGAQPGLWTSGFQAKLPGLTAGERGQHRFAYALDLGGAGELRFQPSGAFTNVALRSAWPHPSFAGAYLPERREVRPDGFTATWRVPFFGRPYPQVWRDSEATEAMLGPAARDSSFGVDFYLPVDAYQKTERAVKYGVLFVLLTFLTFFLYEVFQPFSLHPLQYLLVGAALCLFYLLLLSISEHLPFATAYGIAAAATVGLIAAYSAAVLRGRERAAVMGAVLAALYGYLYVLLQLEDYALLLGSVGLFLILGLVMYVTRKINWYAPRRGREETLPA